jgi:hypothetical protein
MNVEKVGKNTMGKSREKYHMVYGIVPYGIGIVPYGNGIVPYGNGIVPYGTGPQGWKNCMFV